jgi:hypothetical protein
MADRSHHEHSQPSTEAERPLNHCARVVRPARATNRPLRIVRVLDHDGSPTNSVGRMVISGRMADVCAELDRLVAREKTLH